MSDGFERSGIAGDAQHLAAVRFARGDDDIAFGDAERPGEKSADGGVGFAFVGGRRDGDFEGITPWIAVRDALGVTRAVSIRPSSSMR